MADVDIFEEEALAKRLLGSCQLEVESLIQGRQTGDPRLYEAVLLLNKQLEKITRRLSPLVRKAEDIEIGISHLPAPPNFACFSTGVAVRFTWDHVTYASQYEVREGTVWDTAFFRFRTSGLQGNIDPLIYGTYSFLIKTVDSEGNYSESANFSGISVPQIAAPAVNSSVIDNNVLLSWTEPASLFKIDYYLTQRGTTIGKVQGTFTTLFEMLGGTYIYYVTAVDVAGNHSGQAQVEVQVNQPPDFALQEKRVSGLNGSLWNILRLSARPSLLCCWQTQTWHEHFRVLRDWMDVEDQITAGYPIYIQPTAVEGAYVEYIDYGTVIDNTIITITWNTIAWTPQFAMNIVVQMRTSIDGINWTPIADYTEGASQYFRSLRYLEFRLEFTAENDKTFIELYNLTISLNVKRENDGGEVFCDASHAGGTTVYFAKPFKDIESITCTTKSTTEPYIVIFDFADIPNPTFFKIYVFDTMGARVSKTVDWKARGMV